MPHRPACPPSKPVARSGGVDISGNAKIDVEGDIVGRDKNVFTTQLTNIPTSIRIAVVVIALAVVAGVGVLATSQADTFRKYVRGPEPMTGEFNIAVAAFGQLDQDGRIQPSTDGETLSQTIYEGIRKEVQALPNVNAQVLHDGVPLVSERDPRARETALRDLARRLNANLIIFGALVGTGDARTVQPEFYVRSGTRGAEEILGSNELGTPVGAPEDLSKLAPSATLRTRIDALTQFTLGLEALIQKDPPSAVTWFERAVNTSGWKDQEGKETGYLFLGTAYNARREPGDLDRAQDAYTTSARLNQQYARAYVGLGNVYYARYDELRRGGQDSPELLDQALASYAQAEGAADKPNAALVEGKIHLASGNVYLVKAQTGQTEYFSSAEQEFLWVLDQYARGATDLRELVPSAYFGLGVVYERGYEDPRQAASFYTQCLTAAQPGDKEIAASARTQLAALAR